MNLRMITPTAFKPLCDKPAYIKRVVNKEAVKHTVDMFMMNAVFIEEVKLDEEERMNMKNVVQAFKGYIQDNHIKAGVFLRQDRVFLRNDTVPLCCTSCYPRAIVNASRRNRMNF